MKRGVRKEGGERREKRGVGRREKRGVGRREKRGVRKEVGERRDIVSKVPK